MAENEYKYLASSLGKDEAVILALPIPGVTGSEHGVMRVPPPGSDVVINFEPAPGAGEGSRQMWNAVLAEGELAIHWLTAMFPTDQKAEVIDLTLPYLAQAHQDPSVRRQLRLRRRFGQVRGGIHDGRDSQGDAGWRQ